MSKALMEGIARLEKALLAVAARVESNLRKAVAALIERDPTAAGEIERDDREVDRIEVDVEQEGLKLLALHQPVAVDLRHVVAVIKINGDLERIGDLAVNVAERAASLAMSEPVPHMPAFADMTGRVLDMLRTALAALVDGDTQLARKVLSMDAEVDDMLRGMYARVLDALHEEPRRAADYLHVLSASGHLERVADHATNVAEDVIYMQEGVIVRHGRTVA
jgi:phosphate transport system protein